MPLTSDPDDAKARKHWQALLRTPAGREFVEGRIRERVRDATASRMRSAQQSKTIRSVVSYFLATGIVLFGLASDIWDGDEAYKLVLAVIGGGTIDQVWGAKVG